MKDLRFPIPPAACAFSLFCTSPNMQKWPNVFASYLDGVQIYRCKITIPGKITISVKLNATEQKMENTDSISCLAHGQTYICQSASTLNVNRTHEYEYDKQTKSINK